jgi:hypothetical protein
MIACDDSESKATTMQSLSQVWLLLVSMLIWVYIIFMNNKKSLPKEAIALVSTYGGEGGIRTLAGARAPLTI